jgi:hypothetical protein
MGEVEAGVEDSGDAAFPAQASILDLSGTDEAIGGGIGGFAIDNFAEGFDASLGGEFSEFARIDLDNEGVDGGFQAGDFAGTKGTQLRSEGVLLGVEGGGTASITAEWCALQFDDQGQLALYLTPQ